MQNYEWLSRVMLARDSLLCMFHYLSRSLLMLFIYYFLAQKLTRILRTKPKLLWVKSFEVNCRALGTEEQENSGLDNFFFVNKYLRAIHVILLANLLIFTVKILKICFISRLEFPQTPVEQPYEVTVLWTHPKSDQSKYFPIRFYFQFITEIIILQRFQRLL